MDKVFERIDCELKKGTHEPNLWLFLPVNLLRRGRMGDEMELRYKIEKRLSSKGYAWGYFEGKLKLFGNVSCRFRGFVIKQGTLETQEVHSGKKKRRDKWIWSRLALGKPKNIIG